MRTVTTGGSVMQRELTDPMLSAETLEFGGRADSEFGGRADSGLEVRGSFGTTRLGRFLTGPYLLLAAVAAVVVLVSLPLLRGLALRENERDAMHTLGLFGREVFAAAPAAQQPLGALLQADETLLRRLPDTHLVDGGRRLLRHGYLFELTASLTGEPTLLAWPYSHGETGLGAFRLASDGQLYGHPNRMARWSGPSQAPPTQRVATTASEDTWRLLNSGLSRTARD